MGGFTKPKMINVSNWWPGGPYVQRNRTYEPPAADAYLPHTVILLQSRYKVRFGLGRVDTHEFDTFVCREDTLLQAIARHNMLPSNTMDNALWPWVRHKSEPPIKWWKPGENRYELRARALAGEEYKEESGEIIPSTEELDWTEVKREMRELETKRDWAATLAARSTVAVAGVPMQNTPVPGTPPNTQARPNALPINAHRKRYREELQKQPFWRVLIAVTVPTRPIAMSLARLSLSRDRHLPFHAAMDDFGRKSRESQPGLMLSMRADRVMQLVTEISMKLEGYFGGLVGARFHPDSTGHGGKDWTTLADGLAPEHRRVVVKFAQWHPRATEWAERVEIEAEEQGLSEVRTGFVDERGYDVDEDGRRLESQLSEAEVEAAIDDASDLIVFDADSKSPEERHAEVDPATAKTNLFAKAQLKLHPAEPLTADETVALERVWAAMQAAGKTQLRRSMLEELVEHLDEQDIRLVALLLSRMPQGRLLEWD